MIKKYRNLWGAAVVVMLTMAASAQAQIRVAVEDGSGNGTGSQIVSQLNDDTFADFTATLVTAGDIDTPGELANYDVVILGGSGNNNADWTAAMSSALHDFVQAGGGAILTGWGNHDISGAGPVHDPLELIFAGQNVASTNEWNASGDPLTVTTSHPVVDGVGAFSVSGCCTEVNTMALEPGDIELATVGGETAVAIKFYGSGQTVYLGPIYMANTGYTPVGNGSLRSGDPDRLLEQAVVWAASGVVTTSSSSAEAIPVMSVYGLGMTILGVFAVAMRRMSRRG